VAAALPSTALVDIVAPIMRDAGVPAEHCHPHVLRHTFATLYLQRRTHDSGALTKLQELLGHASLETTRGYLHHTRDELERSMRAPDRTVLDSAAAAGVLPCQGRREFPTCDDGNSPPCAWPVRAGRSAAMASRWARMR